ncbi:MAG: hypothetical protein P8X57_06975 [Cyclobacteriaceae bacterium]
MTENIKTDPSENPPLFRSWKGWYILLIANLIAMIILLYLFTIAFV